MEEIEQKERQEKEELEERNREAQKRERAKMRQAQKDYTPRRLSKEISRIKSMYQPSTMPISDNMDTSS